MKLCKDCKYYKPQHHHCSRLEKVSISLVTGMATRGLSTPIICSHDRYEGKCGVEGAYWEARDDHKST